MYEKFFGFSEKPFLIVPNPDLLYLTNKHQTAITYLEYGLRESNGFILFTGEIGSGKTTLVRHLLRNIEDTIDVAVIFNTILSAGDLVEMVANDFELPTTPGNKIANLDTLQQFLIKTYSSGRRALLIVDEAQNLSVEVLEEIRMLSNLQSDSQSLLQIMLVGQPELQDKLSSPNLAQLAQRVVVAYHLGPLTLEETISYIHFRLEKVGGEPDLFEQDAIETIYEAACGIPRAINILCDTALVYAYADQFLSISKGIVEQVVQDRGVNSFGTQDILRNRGAQLVVDRKDTLIPAYEHRITVLEQSLQELNNVVSNLNEKISKIEDAQHNELVQSLTDLIMRERTLNRELLVKYTKLQVKSKQIS